MESYQSTIDWLYSQLPDFSRDGASGYKPGLDTTRALNEAFGSPDGKFRAIHIAGTNGKGSTAHTLAAVLQSAGYRTGLFTSPHIFDFRERIRVDGEMISEAAVVDFVERYHTMNLGLRPTFFELTTVMALEYFAECGVDVAVIETGLGGRLDSTNIITPVLSVITNISLDHTQLLGDTPTAIAAEKAGIIKPRVPVVIGEAQGDVRQVFEQKAALTDSPICFAEDMHLIGSVEFTPSGIEYRGTPFGTLRGSLVGEYQVRNAATILASLCQLQQLGFELPDCAVREGFANVERLTGLTGRWMKVADAPLTICDTGHNIGGWHYLARQIDEHPGPKILVLGFVADKDVDGIVVMLKRLHNAQFIFTQPDSHRALAAEELAAKAAAVGIQSEVYRSVAEAYKNATSRAEDGTMIFVGGSTYVVSDLLTALR